MSKVIISGGDVVTMNPQRHVLRGGSVVVSGDTIAAVGSTSELRRAHPDATVVDARRCVVTPGMINGHQHLTGDVLTRSSIPEGLENWPKIFDWLMPMHAVHSPDDDEISAMLGAVEALQNGVTTLVEAGTVAWPDRVAAGMEAVGLRGTVGTWGWDAPGIVFSAPAAEVLDRQRAVLASHPRGGLVEGWVTLVGHDLASDELLAGAAQLAREAGTNLTMHMSPTSSDADNYLARCGRRPLAQLHHLGVLGPNLVLAHGVHLDDEEVELVLATRTAIAYCPWVYLAGASGVLQAGRHGEIVHRGGRIAIGCDASNSGDVADILRSAALASGIARDQAHDSGRMTSHQTFELATIAGAEAIGMADRVGSLEPGKQADIVIHRTDRWGWAPRGDIGIQLVWGTDGRSVRDVFVAGRHVLRDGKVTTIDTAALFAQAQDARQSLLERAGITITPVWPELDAS